MNTVSMGLVVRVLLASMLFAGGGSAFADQAGPATQPSKEQRQQMAVLHERMAACLRSDKDIAACRDEMRNNCRALMGQQGCPMGTGMHDWMMPRGPADKPGGG